MPASLLWEGSMATIPGIKKSECSGSQTPLYRQKVLFNSKGIESVECYVPLPRSDGRTQQTYCCIIAHGGQRPRLN
jgi:hypothetical protein